eukprot:TRINITY_DN11405_c0_g2_i2.p1 TRINITY_DN11405_c0_g2~~TRINITY_DN11405_c0_g2_i2.p1  ORF type:complete len:304 (+),score=27.21 TRINITY_DN11405_c0_g2_i2:125-1036(+)
MSVIVRSTKEEAAVGVAEALVDDGFSYQSKDIVVVGDVIQSDPEGKLLRGHGCTKVGSDVVATVCGVVERVNQLVSVRVLQGRYVAQIGDLVIGRVKDISNKRWRVDINSRQDAFLLLSAVDLPGGVQRRRTATDELNMRQVFAEGDLISSEIQQIQHDGVIHLHARNQRYGKLVGGQLIQLPSSLILRQRQHIHSNLERGVDTVIGMNGLIFVSCKRELGEDGLIKTDKPEVSQQQREWICRISNAVRVLAKLNLMVYMNSIENVVQLSLNSNTPIKSMLEKWFLQKVIKMEVLRQQSKLSE